MFSSWQRPRQRQPSLKKWNFFQLTSSGIVNPLFNLETPAPLDQVAVGLIINRVKYWVLAEDAAARRGGGIVLDAIFWRDDVFLEAVSWQDGVVLHLGVGALGGAGEGMGAPQQVVQQVEKMVKKMMYMMVKDWKMRVKMVMISGGRDESESEYDDDGEEGR